MHVLLDAVPVARRPDLIAHALTLVEPAGRLLVSHYGTDGSAEEHVRRLGFSISGAATAGRASTVWIDA